MSYENTPQWRAWASHVEEEVIPMLTNSAATVSIVPDEPDVKAGVELGLSILMEKPLILVVLPGRHIPRGLAKAADAIIQGDLSDPDDQARIGAEIKAALDRWAE